MKVHYYAYRVAERTMEVLEQVGTAFNRIRGQGAVSFHSLCGLGLRKGVWPV